MSEKPLGGWPGLANEALLQATHLAHRILATSASWCANSPLLRARLQRENTELVREVGLLREELEIKDSRNARTPPQRRMHFKPDERLRVLALRAARRWSCAETARRFGLAADTIRRWIDEARNPDSSLLKPKAPVNKYPDFVGAVVRQLAQANPKLGLRTIAAMLAREGLVLAKSTVDRMKKRAAPAPRSSPTKPATDSTATTSAAKPRAIVAKSADHVWSVDFTVVPLFMGLALTWWPFSVPSVWPSAWHILVVVDHFSRRLVHTQAFASNPTTKAVTKVLDKVFRQGAVPKHIISDKGSQFGSEWAAWCRRRGIKPRWGAVGQHSSIAVTKRANLSLKYEFLFRVRAPFDGKLFAALLASHRLWFNTCRPHQALDGATPEERRCLEAVKRPTRIEPRARYPDRSDEKPCRPAGLRLIVGCVDGVEPLTTVSLQRVA